MANIKMTREERDEALRNLEERQLALLGVMKKSDDHASKCVKLGLSFKDEYSEEYKAYSDARTEYNENETKIAELEAAEVEEEPFLPFEEGTEIKEEE